ncbi:MAG: nuclear transport factor 2 family protein [Proteobacteria bacterium]|nr:nuclear transport factor 2 family protein [Pseudomonadota bacterium]
MAIQLGRKAQCVFMEKKEKRVSSDIEKRLQHFEDQLALNKLINSYHWRADHFEWQQWSNCFTEDAEFDFTGEFGTMCGRSNIHDICKGNMDHVYGAMQHVIVNLDFEVTGENSAVGHGNLIFTALPDPAQQHLNFQSGGRYNWEFKRTSEGWRISKARLDFIWTRGENVGAVFSEPQAATG